LLDFGFYHMDCMEGMKTFPDGYFDLAVVDPPYGGGADDAHSADSSTKIFGGGGNIWKNRKRGRFGGIFDRYHLCAGDQGDTERRDVGGEVQPARGCL
jgi:DNA modification methylase